MIPPIINLSGDISKAEGLKAFGLSQLRILQEQMGLQDLEQDVRRVSFSDGTLVEAKSVFGLDEVNIFVPIVAEEEIEVEEAKGKIEVIIEVLGSKVSIWTEEVTVIICDPEVILPISWSEDVNPKSVGRSSCVPVCVEGGVSPYTWEVSGEGYWFDLKYTLKVLENVPGRCDPAGCCVELYTDNTICGDAQVKITDICLQTAGGEVPYNKTLKWSDENPAEMDLGATIKLCVIDGEAPYTWKVEGKGFWFDAEHTLQEIITDNKCVWLYAEGSSIVPINIWPFHAGACPPANITVQDDCGSGVGGTVGIFERKKLAWDDGGPIEVCPGGVVDITWTGGTPPFYMVLEGSEDFWFYLNVPPHWKLELYRVGTIAASESACTEETTLTITDTCGDTISRNVKVKQPELTPVISYTTLGMQINEEQTLTAESPSGTECDYSYIWEIASGGGSLSATEGNSTVYTAPSSNADCVGNATIVLKDCSGAVIDSVTIAINAWTGDDTAYEIWDYWQYRSTFPATYTYTKDDPPPCTCEPESSECGGGTPDHCCPHVIGVQDAHRCDGVRRARDKPCSSGETTCMANCEECESHCITRVTNVKTCMLARGFTIGVPNDVRSEALKAAGCCPEALI